jgi:PAS domain S-box-containing protein
MEMDRLVERLPIGVYRTTVEGRFLDVNGAFVDLVGADSKTEVMTAAPIAFHRDSASREQFLRALHASGRVIDHEVPFETVDGTDIWVSTSAWLVPPDEVDVELNDADDDLEDADDVPAADATVIEGLVIDITKRKSIEAESAERERRLTQLMEHSNDALWLFDRDWEELLYINSAYEDIWGQPVEELRADPTRFLDAVHPADRDRVAAAMDDLSAGTPVDVQFRVNPAEEFDRWAWVQAEPISEDGTVSRLAGFTRDITERKREQRRRVAYTETLDTLYAITTDRDRALEEQFEAVLNVVADYLDLPYGFLTRVDSAVNDDEDGTQRVVHAVGSHELLQPGASCPIERSYCRKTIEADGLYTVPDAPAAGWQDDPGYERFQLGSYVGAPVHVDGELAGTLCFAGSDPRDREFSERERALVRIAAQWVSHAFERRRRREELEQRNERLQQFAYIASHDLQEPLRMISSYIDLLEMEYGEVLDEEATEYMEFAVNGANRMRDMIDDLLRFARVESEAQDPEPVDADVALDHALQNLELSIDDHDATITRDTLPTVRADPNQLEQLFQNLLSNAIAYAGSEPPSIHVSAREDVTQAVFSVSDDGIGIPADQRDRIFQVFTQGTRDDDSDSTGIGLAICQRIITRHGGDIWVDSEEGSGSTFSFTLPMADTDDTPPTTTV